MLICPPPESSQTSKLTVEWRTGGAVKLGMRVFASGEVGGVGANYQSGTGRRHLDCGSAERGSSLEAPDARGWRRLRRVNTDNNIITHAAAGVSSARPLTTGPGLMPVAIH